MTDIMELFSGKAYDEISDLGEITYFTCLKTLSESLGKMPVYLMDENKNRIKNHATSYLLQVAPNEIHTPAQLFTYFEYCRNHYGNAY
ncbi:MAG: phage portal protein, partial [Selenomonadaceae bacterium]|nr:phage portal protein [Selenomonadaceae bacterium]